MFENMLTVLTESMRAALPDFKPRGRMSSLYVRGSTFTSSTANAMPAASRSRGRSECSESRPTWYEPASSSA